MSFIYFHNYFAVLLTLHDVSVVRWLKSGMSEISDFPNYNYDFWEVNNPESCDNSNMAWARLYHCCSTVHCTICIEYLDDKNVKYTGAAWNTLSQNAMHSSWPFTSTVMDEFEIISDVISFLIKFLIRTAKVFLHKIRKIYILQTYVCYLIYTS